MFHRKLPVCLGKEKESASFWNWFLCLLNAEFRHATWTRGNWLGTFVIFIIVAAVRHQFTARHHLTLLVVFVILHCHRIGVFLFCVQDMRKIFLVFGFKVCIVPKIQKLKTVLNLCENYNFTWKFGKGRGLILRI